MGKVRKKLKLHTKVMGNMTKALPMKARLVCADNSGAKILEIITVKGWKGRKKKLAEASIADMVMVSVKAGSPDIKKQIHPAIIIRQKKEIRRADGSRIKFADNAAVVVTEDGAMKGTEIRGPVAKEASMRWSSLSGAAKVVV